MLPGAISMVHTTPATPSQTIQKELASSFGRSNAQYSAVQHMRVFRVDSGRRRRVPTKTSQLSTTTQTFRQSTTQNFPLDHHNPLTPPQQLILLDTSSANHHKYASLGKLTKTSSWSEYQTHISQITIIALAAAASLSAALPYAPDLPTVTLDAYPTLSTMSGNNTAIAPAQPSYSTNNQTTTLTLAVQPTMTPPTSTMVNSILGACGHDIGSCASGQCCSGYGFCGLNASYCGPNCMPDYGVCGSNASSLQQQQDPYSFSYAPLSTSCSLSVDVNAPPTITINTAIYATPATESSYVSTTAAFIYAPENNGTMVESATAVEAITKTTTTIETTTVTEFDNASTTELESAAAATVATTVTVYKPASNCGLESTAAAVSLIVI
jgi:hypothetical protein